MRYHIGVDWADQEHAVSVEDEPGQRVRAGTSVPHMAAGVPRLGAGVERLAGAPDFNGIRPRPSEGVR
jgi:hypothetical protein